MCIWMRWNLCELPRSAGPLLCRRIRAGSALGSVSMWGEVGEFQDVHVVEQLNGSNRPGEQERADALIGERGYLGTGGSDAHVVSAIGSCMTEFHGEVRNEMDLVKQLRAGAFRAVRLEDAVA